jgi:glycosyltransferase involved in cell wall biosynthesis
VLETSPTKINYIVESKAWVQFKRIKYLQKYQSKYSFSSYTIGQFYWMWKIGLLRNQPIYFSSWRMVFGLLKKHPDLFTDSHFSYFSAAVTSHSNIGGGLKSELTTPGRTRKDAYTLATRLLKRFKVVSVNSMELYNLLRPEILNIYYCPNGVDSTVFTAKDRKKFNSSNIVIGWVGKDRSAKNYLVIRESLKVLKREHNINSKIVLLKSGLKGSMLNTSQMSNYYKEIDFYLCASWNEGTPNPALEAASSGVPIVSTKVGNMPELIIEGENGFFIEPTVDSIVERFVDLSNISIEKYTKMSLDIRETVDNSWSWDEKIKGYIDVFNKLTDSN